MSMCELDWLSTSTIAVVSEYYPSTEWIPRDYRTPCAMLRLVQLPGHLHVAQSTLESMKPILEVGALSPAIIRTSSLLSVWWRGDSLGRVEIAAGRVLLRSATIVPRCG